MKIMKHKSPDFKRLVQCAPTTKKSKALQIVHYDYETEFMVATDNKRLFATRRLNKPAQGGSYLLAPFAEKEAFVPTDIHADFPKWKSVLPSRFAYRFTLKVPEFVEKLRLSSVPIDIQIGADATVKLLLGETGESSDEVSHYILDLSRLLPLAGSAVSAFIPHKENSLILFTEPTVGQINNPLDLEWFMLVSYQKPGWFPVVVENPSYFVTQEPRELPIRKEETQSNLL